MKVHRERLREAGFQLFRLPRQLDYGDPKSQGWAEFFDWGRRPFRSRRFRSAGIVYAIRIILKQHLRKYILDTNSLVRSRVSRIEATASLPMRTRSPAGSTFASAVASTRRCNTWRAAMKPGRGDQSSTFFGRLHVFN